MRRLPAALGSFLFFCLAPGTLAGLLPWWITGWRVGPPFGGLAESRWIGGVLIVAGLAPLVGAFARFVWQGMGTPAPLAPPTRLVIGGCYRHVRNPMYVAVLVMLLGETVVFADMRLLVVATAAWLAAHLFVVRYEEPTLAHRFGADYAAYRANVPRWRPRLSAWKPGAR